MEKENVLDEDSVEGLFDIPPQKKDQSLNWGKVILFFALYYGISFLIGGLIGVLIGIWSELSGEPFEALLFSTIHHPLFTYVDYIGFIIALVIFKSVRQFIKEALSWKPMGSLRTYLLIGLGFIVIYLSQFLFIDVLKWELISYQIDDGPIYYDSILAYILLFISIAIITPIQEEIMFRGVLQQFLSEKWRLWLGIAVSSLIFGLLHPEYILSGMVMGLVFGIVYYRTKSLWPAIILHALWNAFIILTDILL